MKIETLEKAKELQKKISQLQENKKMVEAVEKDSGYTLEIKSGHYRTDLKALSKPIENAMFQMLKADLESQIADLKKQLEDL